MSLDLREPIQRMLVVICYDVILYVDEWYDGYICSLFIWQKGMLNFCVMCQLCECVCEFEYCVFLVCGLHGGVQRKHLAER